MRANLEAFADAIAGRADYPFTDDEKIADIAILEATTRSASTGEPIAARHRRPGAVAASTAGAAPYLIAPTVKPATKRSTNRL